MLIRHFPVWKQAPFLRLVIPFILGIAWGWYLKPGLRWQLLIATLAVGTYFGTRFFSGFSRFRWNWISGLMLSAFLLVMGSFAMYRQDVRNHRYWLGNNKWDPGLLFLKIISTPVDKGYYYSAMARISAIENYGYPAPEGWLLLRIQKDSSTSIPSSQDLVITNKTPAFIPDNSNPGAFNFQFYCLQQGITHQVHLSGKEYRLIRSERPNSFQRLLNSIQQWVIEVIRKFVPGKKESGVAEALLIGYREDLDKSLVQSYANTGVVHIIAISGLHLGMLYGLLLLFLKPFKKLKMPSWCQLSVVLAGLWMFSFIAGASPSVLRSAVMFSFIAVGNAAKKKANIYNTLSASAFFLLWINPFFLWDPGFQLSYAAVLSIAIFQKPITGLIETTNKILDATWKLVSISFAAQILTTPISLFQFHQQPLLFLFANAVAVPLSGIVLYGEILLLLVSNIHVLANGTGYLVSASLQLLNKIIGRLDATSISVVNQISFSFPELVCCYFLMGSVVFWGFSRQKKYFYCSLVWSLFLVLSRTTAMLVADGQRKIIIYHIPSHSAIDFVSGRNCIELMDQELIASEWIQNFQIVPAHNKFRLLPTDSVAGILVRFPFIFFKGKTCLLVNKQFDLRSIRNRVKVDLLFLHNNPAVRIKEIRQVVDCSLIVWDGSNTTVKTDEWKSECDALALRCHSTPVRGPLILEF